MEKPRKWLAQYVRIAKLSRAVRADKGQKNQDEDAGQGKSSQAANWAGARNGLGCRTRIIHCITPSSLRLIGALDMSPSSNGLANAGT